MRDEELDGEIIKREVMEEKGKGSRVDTAGTDKNFVCRICLSEESDLANPLISPCNCSGTMKHIHFDCLKEWLGSKRTVKEGDFFISYTW